MTIKRVLAEDIVANEMADEAYAYVDAKFKLLKHHTKAVLNGMEEYSVDENLLNACISIVESTDAFSGDTRENVLEHLLMHREQLLKSKKCKDKDESKSKKNNKKNIKNVSADILVNLISALIPGEKIADLDPTTAIVNIVDRETKDNSIIWYLDIRSKDTDAIFSIPVEMAYSNNGDLDLATISGTDVPQDLNSEIQRFVSKLEQLL